MKTKFAWVKSLTLILASVSIATALGAQTLYVAGGATSGIAPTQNSNLVADVGIGTPLPGARLETTAVWNGLPAISGTAQSTAALRISNSQTTGVLDSGINGSSGAWFQSTDETNLALTYPILLNPYGGKVGVGTTTPGYSLDVAGPVRTTGGILDSDNYFEKIFTSIVFPATANQAVNICLGNQPLWGYIEVEATGTFGDQSSVGKLTKLFAVGLNSGGTTFVRETRIADAMGTIPDNLAIGDITWDAANSKYVIPISHIVSTSNHYTVKVRMFTDSALAAPVFNSITVSALYPLSALPRNYVYFNGNVGIGTTNPTQKLSVNGTIQAKEVIVQTGWSDYVFASTYQMMPLSEVEHRIKTEHHLPGIPSADEVATHGISLGDMQAKLLAKIEELTLRQIEQEKNVAAQTAAFSERIERLERENASLRQGR